MWTTVKKLLIAAVLGIVLLTGLCAPARAQTPALIEPITAEGTIVAITETGKETFNEELVPFQQLEILLTTTDYRGQTLSVKNTAAGADITAQFETYAVGDKIRLNLDLSSGQPQAAIAGHVKRYGLLSLAMLFILAVLLIGRFWGLMSLLGLAISFFIIFRQIIPMIIKGYDPVVSTLIGAALIIPTTFYVSHGWNKKTHVGVISTLISLALTGFLALIFINRTYLTGFASEDVGFLQIERHGTIDIKGLLLAGIIIGTLGILDDVTIGQASVVEQIKRTNPAIGFFKLFQKGMRVGQDHISSMVNTLVLVYAGASLPLLLLFFGSNKNLIDIIEFELVAEEIVKMLVGSIGLIMAAPLATFLAAHLFSKEKFSTGDQENTKSHGHHH